MVPPESVTHQLRMMAWFRKLTVTTRASKSEESDVFATVPGALPYAGTKTVG